MSGFFDVLRALLAPAVIAAVIYLLLAYAIIPLARRHRERYNQYLPLSSLSQRTSGFRERIADRVSALVLPSFRHQHRVVDGSGSRRGSGSGEDLAFGEEEGESMVGFDVSRRDRSVRGGNIEIHSDRRLSRDLEEGFKDDSEEESGDDRRR